MHLHANLKWVLILGISMLQTDCLQDVCDVI